MITPSAPAASATFSVRHAVLLRKRLGQPVRPAVGVAVQLADRALERLDRGRKGAELPFVRGELDDPLEPELALDLLDRLPRLVRNEPRDRGTKEVAVGCHEAEP